MTLSSSWDKKDSYKDNHCSEDIPFGNSQTKVIIFCKSRPSDCQLKRIWLQSDWDWITIQCIALLCIACPTYRCNSIWSLWVENALCVSFEVKISISADHWLQCHEKIGNIELIYLKMLVVSVWISVWMCTKHQGSKWNNSVLKKLLKIGFEFRFQRVNTSSGAMFGITKNTLSVSLAVWNFLW